MLREEIKDLTKERDLLKDQLQKAREREADQETEKSNILEKVEHRSQLEERVINIGLSNNYFKNIAEIFKKRIESWYFHWINKKSIVS